VSSQAGLAELEARILKAAGGDWIAQLDKLIKLSETLSAASVARILATYASAPPSIEAAARKGIAEAFGIGGRDALAQLSAIDQAPATYSRTKAEPTARRAAAAYGFGSPKHVESIRARVMAGGSATARGMIDGLDADAVDALDKSRKLAAAGAEKDAYLAPLKAHQNKVTGSITGAVNQAANEGITGVGDEAGIPTVWIAERNACVECLAYSGKVAQPGGKYPNGLTYGRKAYSAKWGTFQPPKHPNCRCDQELLFSQDYADALGREADRSVLRGFSLENEGMGVRVAAAERLLAKPGLVAPKSVKAYAAKAEKTGKFPNRGKAALNDDDLMPPNAPR